MSRTYFLVRAVRGPLMLIAFGLLLWAQRFADVSLMKTWPALLILLGVLKLVERMALGSGPAMPPPPPGMGPGTMGGQMP